MHRLTPYHLQPFSSHPKPGLKPRTCAVVRHGAQCTRPLGPGGSSDTWLIKGVYHLPYDPRENINVLMERWLPTVGRFHQKNNNKATN